MGQSGNAWLRISIVIVTLVCSRWSAASTVSDWSGGSGNWSSDGSPGWNGTGVPNAPGATAQKLISGNVTTTQDIADGVTVGTINLGGSSANHWKISTANPITLNQDGPGPGFATISNTNSAAGSNTSQSTANFLELSGASTLNLADDLLIQNTGGTNYYYGAIRLLSPIIGNGNLSIYNNVTTLPTGNNERGGICLFNANSFVGNTLIEKGLVAFSNSASFGHASNVITLGQAGSGSVVLVATDSTSSLNVPQNVVVAAGTGGTTYLGSQLLDERTVQFSGNVALNSNLTLHSFKTTSFAGNFSGAGGLTHDGNNTFEPSSSLELATSFLSGTNSYTGPTKIVRGTLAFARRVSLYNGNSASWTAANLTVQSGAFASFDVGGTEGFTAADIQTLSTLGTASNGFRNGSFMALNVASGDFAIAGNIGGANAVGLIKNGPSQLTLSGANTYTGPTVINAGAVRFTQRSSFYHNLPGSWIKANLTVKKNAAAIFCVGGPGEFTTADMEIIGSFLSVFDATGFNQEAILGFDTTNAAGGEFTHSGALVQPTSQPNANGVVIEKHGPGTLVLSGNNTYRGDTRVFDGTLKITGTHITPSPHAQYVVAGAAGSTGNLILEGGAISLINSPDGIQVGGAGGNGTLMQMGGSIVAYKMTIATKASVGGVARYDLLAGTATLNGPLYVGYNGNGTVNNAGIVNSGAVLVGIYGVGTISNSGTISVNGDMHIGAPPFPPPSPVSDGRLNNLGSGSISARNLILAGVVSNAGSISLSRDASLSGGKYIWQLSELSISNPGVDFGMLTAAGNLVLAGTSTLELDFSLVGLDGPSGSNAFWDTSHTWRIIDTATNTGDTNFATLFNQVFTSGIFTTSVGTGADLGDIFLNFTAGAVLHPGDFDSDGDVDGADFVAWQTNFPTAMGATLAQGDADADGDVDGADFVVWQTNFPFTPGPGASPVPEPTALLLGAISAIGLFALRRRK